MSRWVWSAFCSGRTRVQIKNSSKHIVISHLTTLISTALHSHCSTQLARFPEEFNLSLPLSILSLLSQCHPHPPLFNPFHLQIHFLSLSRCCWCRLISLPPPSLAFNSYFSGSILPSLFLLVNFSPASFLPMHLPLISCSVHPTLLPSFLPLSLPPFPLSLSFLFLFLPWGAGYWCKHTQSSEWFLSCSNRSTGLPPLSRQL